MGLLVKGKVVLHQSLLPGGLVGVYSIVLSFSKPHIIWLGTQESSRWDWPFEYPQHVLWFGKRKGDFSSSTNIWRLWLIFFCLIWFFTSHQQSFSYKGTGLPGLNQYLARINVLAQGTNTVTQVRLKPSVSSQALYYWAPMGVWLMLTKFTEVFNKPHIICFGNSRVVPMKLAFWAPPTCVVVW